MTGNCRGWYLTPSSRLKKKYCSSSEDKGKRPIKQRDSSESKNRQIKLKAMLMTIVHFFGSAESKLVSSPFKFHMAHYYKIIVASKKNKNSNSFERLHLCYKQQESTAWAALINGI